MAAAAILDFIGKNIEGKTVTVVCAPLEAVTGASGLKWSASLLVPTLPVAHSSPQRSYLGNKASSPARHTTSTMWHSSGSVQCARLFGNPPDSSIYRATNVIGVDVN